MYPCDYVKCTVVVLWCLDSDIIIHHTSDVNVACEELFNVQSVGRLMLANKVSAVWFLDATVGARLYPR